MEVIINNLKETRSFAKKFAKLLVGGEVILLNGDLGAGKTTFTREVLFTIIGNKILQGSSRVTLN